MSRGFCGELPSKDIKKEEWYIASDGCSWSISASDYGYALTNYPGYETIYNPEDNNLGFEKNFEIAFEKFTEICKRNDWTFDIEPTQDKETLDEVSDGLPTKELTIQDCIERLENLFKNSNGSDYTYQLEISNSPFNTIKQKVEEQENIIKLLFEKNVDISLLTSSDNVEEYNFSYTRVYGREEEFELTQEEFELLKR